MAQESDPAPTTPVSEMQASAMQASAMQASSPLAQALEWGRERFNARYEHHTKALRRPVDPKEFSIHLMENMGTLVDAVAAHDPSSVNRVVEELFEISLELMSAGYVGLHSRYRLPEMVFRQLLPATAPFMAQNPRLVAGSLINAALAMESEPSARPEEWVERMKMAATVAKTPKGLLDAGIALSWHCGMAHFRSGALELARTMPVDLALHIFHREGAANRNELMERLSTKWTPGEEDDHTVKKTRKPVAVIGGFTGFGGPFGAPPTVYQDQDSLAARDDIADFIIFADRFGAVVKRREPAEPQSGVVKPDKETVRFVKSVFPNAVGGPQTKSWAWDGTTLAITLKVSHKVFLFSLRRP